MPSASPHQLRSLLDSKKLRFVLAGLLNTLIDFAVFNALLHAFGAKLWLANLCSTTVAMIVSFTINKHAVFADRNRYSYRQFMAFVLVTALGVWGLQTLVIVSLTYLLQPIGRAALGTAAGRWLIPNVAKGIATVLSAIWNYLWYDRLVFVGNVKKVRLSAWI